MRTQIPESTRSEAGVAHAEQILRSCVHCGFCNATCPTYVLTGNELEGPRGRIYLLKSVLEGSVEASERTLEHIDNCLGCLSCETTCPSGVRYGQLLEEGRPRLERLRAAGADRLQRWLLTRTLPHPRRMRFGLRLARWVRPFASLLPASTRSMLDAAPAHLDGPGVATPGVHAAAGPQRLRVALLTGCAQQVVGAEINDAAVRLLTRLGVEVTVPDVSICCGALTHHMGERRQSRALMEDAIRRWDALLAEGIDAIVLTTSGCQTAVAEYGDLFAGDPLEAAARRVSVAVRDVSQIVAELGLPTCSPPPAWRIAYHDACSMQHGLRLSQGPRQLLRDTGVEPLEIPEAHLCCGSAGTYHLLRPHLARQLQTRKAEAIRSTGADLVVAGNIGCLEQIAGAGSVPCIHTVQWLDWRTGGPRPSALTEETIS